MAFALLWLLMSNQLKSLLGELLPPLACLVDMVESMGGTWHELTWSSPGPEQNAGDGRARPPGEGRLPKSDALHFPHQLLPACVWDKQTCQERRLRAASRKGQAAPLSIWWLFMWKDLCRGRVSGVCWPDWTPGRWGLYPGLRAFAHCKASPAKQPMLQHTDMRRKLPCWLASMLEGKKCLCIFTYL